MSKIKVSPAEGIRVIVSVEKPKAVSKGGIVLAVNQKQERAGLQRGTVLSIGSAAWKNTLYGFGLEGWKPWCKVGDKVFFKRYAGVEICINDSVDMKDEDREYVRVLSDDDIECTFEEIIE